MYVATRQLVASPVANYVEWRLLDGTVAVPLPHMVIRVCLAARRVFDVFLTLLFRRVDVVLIFAPFNFVRLLDKTAMCLLARLFRKRVVISFRLETRRANRMRWLMEGIVRLTVWACDAVICQADRAAELLGEIVGSRERIVVIPNWIDLRPFKPIAAARKGTWQGDAPNILYIGRFDEYKGVLELAEAAAMLRARGRLLYVTYAGAGAAAEPIAARCHELGIADIVKFLGAVDGERKLAALAAADVLVLVSETEGLSNAILEAMACGMPVVASPVGATPTLIADGDGGFLVPPRDAGALADALDKILGDPDLAHRMGQINFANVCARHDIEAIWPTVAATLTGNRAIVEQYASRADTRPFA
jgi:glycosyltransferase involved in cell wall biosynthesis